MLPYIIALIVLVGVRVQTARSDELPIHLRKLWSDCTDGCLRRRELRQAPYGTRHARRCSVGCGERD